MNFKRLLGLLYQSRDVPAAPRNRKCEDDLVGCMEKAEERAWAPSQSIRFKRHFCNVLHLVASLCLVSAQQQQHTIIISSSLCAHCLVSPWW
jgi:hypothetical protein